jgi:putative transposase
VGKDRVQRICRREGLKVPKKHRPRGRLWLNDGSCIRLRPERSNHVWSFDFVESRTHDGRRLRIMTLLDDYSRECLALKGARRITSFGVIKTLADAMLKRGVLEHGRCDNGPEMIAKAVRKWLTKLATKTLDIEPGSPWEKGSCESFNGKLQDACLKREIFSSLRQAQIVIGSVEGPHQSRPAAFVLELPASLHLSPCRRSHGRYPRPPPCPSLTKPDPKSRSGHHVARFCGYRQCGICV